MPAFSAALQYAGRAHRASLGGRISTRFSPSLFREVVIQCLAKTTTRRAFFRDQLGTAAVGSRALRYGRYRTTRNGDSVMTSG